MIFRAPLRSKAVMYALPAVIFLAAIAFDRVGRKRAQKDAAAPKKQWKLLSFL